MTAYCADVYLGACLKIPLKNWLKLVPKLELGTSERANERAPPFSEYRVAQKRVRIRCVVRGWVSFRCEIRMKLWNIPGTKPNKNRPTEAKCWFRSSI